MKWISVLLLAVSMQAQSANRVEISKDEIVIKFKAELMNQYSLGALNSHENVSSFVSAITNEDSQQARVISKSASGMVAVVKVAEGMSIQSMSEQINANPYVEWAHPNRIYHGEYREGGNLNDPKIDKQYHLKQIEAFKAFSLQLGRPEVVIAVTDDGFDLDHKDLLNSWHYNTNEIPNNQIDDDNNGYIDDYVGWNFNQKNNNPDYDDDYGSHGTHIAGIINATPNNSIGVTGVSPGLKIMPLKFYGPKRWTSAMIYETYSYAVNNGAQIITTSYNINAMSRDPIYQDAVKYAHDNSVLVFNSAGNGNTKNPERSRLDTLLLVSSVDAKPSAQASDVRSSFSNYGYQVDISAPGGGIMATGVNDRYVSMSGTSMATPMAAAMAGLIMSQYPQMNVRQVLHTLLVSVDNIDEKNSRYINQLGTGRINALKSVDNVVEPLQITIPGIHDNNLPRKYLANNKVSIRFHGAPGSSFRPIQIVSKNGGKQNYRELRVKQLVNLGTNQIDYTFEALDRGQYQLVIAEDSFFDPFGRTLDGDRDGVNGGHMFVDFEVK